MKRVSWDFWQTQRPRRRVENPWGTPVFQGLQSCFFVTKSCFGCYRRVHVIFFQCSGFEFKWVEYVFFLLMVFYAMRLHSFTVMKLIMSRRLKICAWSPIPMFLAQMSKDQSFFSPWQGQFSPYVGFLK